MNLVSTIMSFLAPAIVNKIASSLGLGQGLAGKLIGAAVPAILAALTSTANRRDGGGLLSQVLGKQDPGLLDGFAGMLGGAGQQSLIDGGTSALTTLLGGSSMDALAGALGKFAGASDSQSKSLLGMLAPVVLGSLAKEQRRGGVDAAGLTGLLNGQKSNIAAAMPPGFSDLLKGTGLLNAIADQPGSAPAHRTTPSIPTASPGMMRWLLPAALAALAAYFVVGRLGDGGPPSIVVPGVGDVSKQAQGALDALNAQLASVKDEASAKAALPKLQDIASQIDKMKGVAQGLPADARGPMVKFVAGALPGIAATVEKVLGMPGVAAILKPVLDQIMGSLGSIKA